MIFKYSKLKSVKSALQTDRQLNLVLKITSSSPGKQSTILHLKNNKNKDDNLQKLLNIFIIKLNIDDRKIIL